MRVLKSRFVALFALIVIIPGNPAQAEKLNPKWTAARTEANALGDRAKAGDRSAAQKLEAYSLIKGYAPFAHNIGWVYQNGYAGAQKSLKTACGLYAKAAKENYPPSMHTYANLCLLPRARSSEGAADPGIRVQAMGLLSRAAMAGWTASAILYAEQMLNRRGPVQKNARKAGRAVEAGLQSSPSPSEKVTLSYLKGMVAIFANRPRGTKSLRAYRQGEKALKYAASKGHPAAGGALPELQKKWIQSINHNAAAWAAPAIRLGKCADNIQSSKPDKFLARNCFGTLSLAQSLLRYADEDAAYLSASLSGKYHGVLQKYQGTLQEAIHHLSKKSAAFRAEQSEWQERFLKRYVERVNSKNWGE